ncbi:phytanoyl-CoA dioxygenase family protein [Marinicrinis sediminis]|uniref:Phytanoyl-CoA dioxygenase family protein n=1 Tax=Marinicrinis sediminis TaxID=1652465 RepID=A0ABW5RF83_9BACL
MSAAQLTAEEKQFFQENGYLIKKGVYTQYELDRLSKEYVKIWIELLAEGKILQNPEKPLTSLYPNRLRDFHRGNRTITAFMLKTEAISLLESLIGEEPLAIQSGYYYKPPGSRGLGFHQDNYHIGVSPGTSYAMWVSMEATNAENGSLVFVPGTHQLPLVSSEVVPGSSDAYGSEVLRVPEGYEKIQIETEAGDVVFFNGNMYHGSTKNRSEHRYRRSFVTHFAPARTEKITLNYGQLVGKDGRRVRRKLNTEAKIMEMEQSVFHYQDASFYDQIIKGVTDR